MSAVPSSSVPASARDRGNVDERWDAICNRGDLTRRQLLIWGGDRVAAGAPVFAEGVLLHLHGPLDPRRFEAALQAVVDGSDALRAVVDDVEGYPVQRVRAHVPVTVDVVDLEATANPRGALEGLAADRVERVGCIDSRFDTILVRLARDHWVWLLTQHQLVSDAWSFRLVHERVEAAYHHAARAIPALDESPQFADYVAYERELRGSSRAAAARRYWRDCYPDATRPPKPMVGDPRVATAICRTVRRLDRVSAARLTALAHRAGSYDVGVFAVAATLVAAHLHRSAGTRALVLDVPFANRSSARFKCTIGSFMNVSPVRIDVEGHDTFEDVFARCVQAIWEASQHQWYADRVGRGDQPYDVLVNIYRQEIAGRTFGQIPLRIDWPAPTHRFSTLTIAIADFGATGEPALALDFQRAAFGAAERADVVHDVGRLLERCLEDPRRRIDQPAAETRGGVPSMETETVWTRFVGQAARTPDATALRAAGVATRYAEVRHRADAVAAMLAARGVRRGEVVAVWGERGLHVLVSMLGILASGAVYLPIDPRWPAARIRHVMRLSRARVALAATRSASAATLEPSGDDGWCVLSTEVPAAEGMISFGGNGRDDEVRPPDLAYVVYTSGTTGEPKGALVDHAALLNHLDAKIALLSLGADDRVAQTAAVSFDVSIWQYLAVLMVGGAVEIVDDDVVRDPERLVPALVRGGVTVLETVPALLDIVLEAEPVGFGALRWLVVTGDALAPELCRRWLHRHPAIPLVNAYGPTECADDVAHHVLRTAPPTDAVRIPIGRPIANVRLAVLDGDLRPVAEGAVGELVVSGVAVGRGYLHDAGRTAASFVRLPNGERAYRTGDRGRECADGTFECLGRVDDQVKIRGARVELGEVAAVVELHPAVRQAAIAVRDVAGGDRRLVAYVVLDRHGDSDGASDGADVGDTIRAFVADRLPSTAVPAVVRVLDALPLNANGKVDRAALPSTIPEAHARPGVVEQVDERDAADESALSAIWGELLGVPGVARDDDFFALGGDSLLVYHMLARAHRDVGVVADVAEFLRRPTIATLTARRRRMAPPDLDPEIYARELAAIEALSDAEAARLLRDELRQDTAAAEAW